MLTGRQRESERIERLLVEARLGQSGVLVIRGEPGIGKTALLGEVRSHAHDMAVLTARGIESEAEFAFAGLHELLTPELDILSDLPAAQAGALQSVLGLGPPGQFEPLIIGVATLGFLAAVADRQPLVVLLDDVQWLDRASAGALLFAARRLRAERLAVIAATRDDSSAMFLRAGFEEVRLSGLDVEESASLLSHGSSVLSPAVVRRIHRETGGNPLALLEAARELVHDPGAGQSAMSLSLSSGPRLEEAFARRIAVLPAPVREALLLAAASDTGANEPVLRALELVGRSSQDLAIAEDAGLLMLGDVFAFPHPLIRSAAYHSASPSQRREAHAALAQALAHERDNEERVWHLARSVVGSNERIAGELERLATLMTQRSGFPAAAAALERAASLTPESPRRSQRLCAAAEAAWLAGDAPLALRVLARAEADASEADLAIRARILGLKGHIVHICGAAPEAGRLLREAAEAALAAGSGEAVSILADAHECFTWAGDAKAALEAAERLAAIADRSNDVERFFSDLLLGSGLAIAGRTAEGLPLIERALQEEEANDVLRRNPRHLAWAGIGYGSLDESEAGRQATLRAIKRAEEQEAVGVLPKVWSMLAARELEVGDWSAAYAAATRAATLARDLGQETVFCASLMWIAMIQAGRGQEAECRRSASQCLELAERIGLLVVSVGGHTALGLLELGLGRPAEAARHFVRAQAAVPIVGFRQLPDLAEAYVRSADPRSAGLLAALADLEAQALRPLQVAIAARARALVDQQAYEFHLRRALSHHELSTDRFAEARTRLVFGELLRRDRRRIEAREQLRAALGVFDLLGAAPWSARTRRELRASGETIPRRHPTAAERLTPQELQIALQVADGGSNRDVGAALFLSPKTVEFHLTSIYRKLDVNSRAQLIRLFATQEVTAAAVTVGHQR